MQCTRRLQPRWPAADHHQSRESFPQFRVLRPGCLLEKLHDVVAQRHGVAQGCQFEGVLPEPLVAEVGGRGSRSDDKIVVRLPQSPQAGFDPDRPVLIPDFSDLAQEAAHIGVPLEVAANGVGDLARIEGARSHLIQQGREEVEVVAVNQQDLDRLVGERSGGEEAPETRADDDHLGPIIRSHLALSASSPRKGRGFRSHRDRRQCVSKHTFSDPRPTLMYQTETRFLPVDPLVRAHGGCRILSFNRARRSDLPRPEGGDAAFLPRTEL